MLCRNISTASAVGLFMIVSACATSVATKCDPDNPKSSGCGVAHVTAMNVVAETVVDVASDDTSTAAVSDDKGNKGLGNGDENSDPADNGGGLSDPDNPGGGKGKN